MLVDSTLQAAMVQELCILQEHNICLNLKLETLSPLLPVSRDLTTVFLLINQNLRLHFPLS
jgi:hypothetical protein